MKIREPEFNNGYAWFVVIVMIGTIVALGPLAEWWAGK